MKLLCIKQNTNKHEQNASFIRLFEINYVWMKANTFITKWLLLLLVLSCTSKSEGIDNDTERKEILGIWEIVYSKDKTSGYEWADTAGITVEMFGYYLNKFEIKGKGTFLLYQQEKGNWITDENGTKVIFYTKYNSVSPEIRDTFDVNRMNNELWFENTIRLHKAVLSSW